MANAIQQKFQLTLAAEQKRLSKALLSELKLLDDMKDGDEFARDRELLGLLEGETVATAVELIGGMTKAIEGFVREESTKRDLASVETHFL